MKISEIALCSQYHFQRMFVFLTGIPLSEYIRRRRLTLAALDIQNTDDRLIDIAVKYGYTSVDAFSRAFQTMHNVTPSRARNKGVLLKAQPRIAFTLSLKGLMEMDYRIEEKEPIGIVGAYSEMYPDNTTDYYIGVITTTICPDEFVKLDIPAQTWAVFEIVGALPTAMSDILWTQFFGVFPHDWLRTHPGT